MNISNLSSFKARVIDKFGSIDNFERKTNRVFNLLPKYESVQEVAEDLAPKVKTIQASLEIVKEFHEVEDLYSITLPITSTPTSSEACPTSWDHLSTTNSWILVDRIQPMSEHQPRFYSSPGMCKSWREIIEPAFNRLPNQPTYQPHLLWRLCVLCTAKGFDAKHFTLNCRCEVIKLSSSDIIQAISATKVCPSCAYDTKPHTNASSTSTMAPPRYAPKVANMMGSLSTKLPQAQ